MTIRAIRQSGIGLSHANLTRDLPTRPSAFERLGTLKAEVDPLADIARDLRETRAIIVDLNQQISLGRRTGKVRQRHAQADDQAPPRSAASQAPMERANPLKMGRDQKCTKRSRLSASLGFAGLASDSSSTAFSCIRNSGDSHARRRTHPHRLHRRYGDRGRDPWLLW
jgi:hypothetical protein